MISTTINGTADMKRNARTIGDKGRALMLEGTGIFQHEEMTEMKKRTPVDTGELRDSGFEVEPVFVGDQVQGGLGFDAPHALFVHEDLEAQHSNGQAKFMESVLNESRPYFADRVGEHVKRGLGM
jgi:hypothetical protein